MKGRYAAVVDRKYLVVEFGRRGLGLPVVEVRRSLPRQLFPA